MTEIDRDEFQTKVERILAKAFGGLHNLPGKLRWHGGGAFMYAEINISRDLATWDVNDLTVLVIGAHDECVRLEINPCSPKLLKLRFHPRTGREGRMSERHPTIEQAIELYRRNNP